MKALSRFNAWADRTDLGVHDLARYRVIYGVVGLLMFQNLHWFTAYPDSLYTPPPGPFELFTGFPAPWLALVLEVVLACGFACLIFGVWVTPASVTITVVYTLLTGWSYGLGKINHTILLDVAPILLAAAGWSGQGKVRGWVLRLLAFILGLAMMSAAIGKTATGWLDLDTRAVRAHMIISEYQLQNSALFSHAFTNISSGAFWELIDWVTVFMELSVIVLAFTNWRAFRVGLALLSMFHLSVLLTLNIGFSSSILIYAAFVPWSRVPVPHLVQPVAVRWEVAVGVGVLAWAVVHNLGNLTWLVDPALLVAAAGVGGWYLARTVRDVLRRSKGRGGDAGDVEFAEARPRVRT